VTSRKTKKSAGAGGAGPCARKYGLAGIGRALHFSYFSRHQNPFFPTTSEPFPVIIIFSRSFGCCPARNLGNFEPTEHR
jgi:hypothetical protein